MRILVFLFFAITLTGCSGLMIGGGSPVVPMPDFKDALRTQRVLEAAIVSARERMPVSIDHDDSGGSL